MTELIEFFATPEWITFFAGVLTGGGFVLKMR